MNSLTKLLPPARTALAGAGLIISWNTLASTRHLEHRRERGDQTVKDAIALTPQSRLFGVPNAMTATAYFAVIESLSITGLADRRAISRALAVGSWLSLGVSLYLTYQLLFVLRRNCPICLRSHVVNAAMTAVLTLRAAPVGSRRR